jgi:FtsH-binding integral membrane protein
MSAFGTTPETTVAATAERAYLREVFAWMALGLALTTGVAVWLHNAGDVLRYFDEHPGALWAVIGAQLVMVLVLSFALGRLSGGVAATLFCLYAGLVGVTFAILLGVYTDASVITAFAGAGGVFAGMAALGYTTKIDLSRFRGILLGALIGIVVASIAYVFVGGETLNLIIGWGGVIVFSALTAYDMQKIKQIGAQGFANEDDQQKAAIFGALALYLDFVNLVISLLRIFGSARR